jgi:hypothetical protein
MEEINGISLEKYANLVVKMSDCGEDEEACNKIAESEGHSRDDWKAAKDGWSKKMSDPSDMGKTAMAFMPFYQAALANKNADKEPISLEEYTRIHSDMAFRKDPNDSSKKINYEDVLKENNITVTKWGEFNSFWTPKVSEPGELHDKFASMTQQNSDKILGIER